MPAKGTPAWHAAQKAQAGGKPQVDKTFGMKNKKGKAVQAKFHTQNGGADNAAQEKRRAEMKKAEQEAMNALLFQEAKKKNEKNKEKAKKEEKKKEEDKEPTEMLARIEWLKKRTTTRTPVTLDRLKAWIERKKAKKEAERLAKLGNAKAALSSGKKLAGVTGRELFQVDSTLFVDDAEAAEDTFDERTGAGTLSDDDDEGGEEGGEEGAARAGGGEAAAGSHPGASVSDLVLGERVEGRYMGGKAWYGGVVRAVAADGTATLEYEDGDIEESVPRDFIRPLDRAPPAAAAGDAAGGSGAAGPSAAGTSAAGASAAAAADAVALVEDESLFADDDFPEDDELGAAAAPAAGKAPAAGSKAPAAAVDLNAVDESLFLDEDLPSDDD